MKSIADYLAESAKDHNYVIKFAEQPTEEKVAIIAEWLKRYDLKNMSAPTLIENDHTDFIDVPNRETYAIAISLGTPIVPYILLQDLKLAANISEKFIVIRSENEPIQQYAAYDNWSRKVDKDEKEDGNVPGGRLSTDREYFDAEQPEVDNLFGDQYNKKLLSYLAGVAEKRPERKIDPPSSLFSWLKLEDVGPGEPHQDTSDFNAYIDTPKPTTKGSNEKPVDDKYMNSKGTMSTKAVPSVKFFKDPITGKAKQVVKPVESK